MKTNITTTNFRTYDKLNEMIEKKIEKLDKYFDDDKTVAKVVLSKEGNFHKIEITINADGKLFRAESATTDIHESIDIAIDKLSKQMSRFKGKLRKRYNDNKALKFEFLPENEDEVEETHVVREKVFDLAPMDVEEAILQMEMLQHDFFVFMNMDTGGVNVVYKRKGDNYGVIAPTY